MDAKSILLVDDEEDLLESTQFLLEHKGHKVFTAKDGIDAVSSYIENKPCLVFMDMKMPRMNGLDAFEKIVNHDQNAKVIIITGFNLEKNEVEHAQQMGLKQILQKPLGIKQYEKLIEKYD